MRHLTTLLVVLALLVACSPQGGGDEPTPTTSATAGPSGTATATETGTLSQSCTFTAGELRVTVPYPADWHRNDTGPTEDGSAMPPCRVLHHEPFELPRTHELTGYDLFLKVEYVAYERVVAGDDPMHEELSRRETEIAGRPATVRELRATEDGLSGPAGTRHAVHAVDLGQERTLMLVTFEAEGLDYARNKELLDQVSAQLEIERGAAVSCSASGGDMPDAPAAQPDLPAEVARARAEIYHAARACDYGRLAQLLASPFTYSFGHSGDAVGFWRELEDQGEAPMRHLVGVLNRPHGTVGADPSHWVWPSAFAYPSWEDVPERDREALKPLYDEQDFADWARFGAYIGYRVSVTAEGEWTAFVAGD